VTAPRARRWRTRLSRGARIGRGPRQRKPTYGWARTCLVRSARARGEGCRARCSLIIRPNSRGRLMLLSTSGRTGWQPYAKPKLANAPPTDSASGTTMSRCGDVAGGCRRVCAMTAPHSVTFMPRLRYESTARSPSDLRMSYSPNYSWLQPHPHIGEITISLNLR